MKWTNYDVSLQHLFSFPSSGLLQCRAGQKSDFVNQNYTLNNGKYLVSIVKGTTSEAPYARPTLLIIIRRELKIWNLEYSNAINKV